MYLDSVLERHSLDDLSEPAEPAQPPPAGLRALAELEHHVEHGVAAQAAPGRPGPVADRDIPGISRQAACDILVEIGGDVNGFKHAHACSAWAGVSPGNNESAGKRRHARSVRGNPHLRTVLVECALVAARTKNCQFQGYHKAIQVRLGYKRATVATAHKPLCTIHSVLKHQRPCQDPEFDYEALMVNLNAARWIRKLQEYGYWPSPTRKPKSQVA